MIEDSKEEFVGVFELAIPEYKKAHRCSAEREDPAQMFRQT